MRVLVLGAGGALLVACLLAIAVTGPVVVRVPRLDFDVARIAPERLRRDVERLCGEFSPRGYQQVANLDRAAQWIAEEMRAAGLEAPVSSSTSSRT